MRAAFGDRTLSGTVPGVTGRLGSPSHAQALSALVLLAAQCGGRESRSEPSFLPERLSSAGCLGAACVDTDL